MTDTKTASILDRQSRDIQKLPPLPVGTYIATVLDVTFEPVGAKQTPAVNVLLGGFHPHSGVDQVQLAKCGDPAAHTVTYNLFLTEAAAWRLPQFLDHLGIEEGDRTLRERLAEAPSKQVKVTITHTVGKAGSRSAGETFANVDSTAKL